MKMINHDYARNGVRIALNSKFILLVALAFLCLAIVCLCVFCNLNALATDNIAFASSTDDYYSYDTMTSGFDYSNFAKYNTLNLVEVSDGIIAADTSLSKNTIYYYNCSVSYADNKLTISFDKGTGMVWIYNGFTGIANNNKGFTFEILATATNDFYMSYRDASTGYTTSFTGNTSISVDDNSLRGYYIALASNTARNVVGLRGDNGTIVIEQLIYVLFGKTGTNTTNLPKPFFIPFNENIVTRVDPNSYEVGWAYGYSNGRSEGYAVGFDDGVNSTDTSWDALYALKGHLAITLGLLPENFENSESVAYNNPVGSSNIIFTYMNIVYENSGWLANCSPTGAALTINHGSNSGSYTAIKIAENISGVVTIPYISNYANFRLMIVKGGIPTFRSATNYNYVVGNLPCIEVDCGNNADVYLVSNNTGTDITLDIGNIFVDGFSPVGIYIYNSQSKQYQNGYSQGLKTGIATADSQVQEAFEAGKVVGRNEASNYTFSSLIGAVIDTPITAAKGLLDFNILGTNMYGLFVGLLSLAVVLFIIRIFSRGL